MNRDGANFTDVYDDDGHHLTRVTFEDFGGDPSIFLTATSDSYVGIGLSSRAELSRFIEAVTRLSEKLPERPASEDAPDGE